MPWKSFPLLWLRGCLGTTSSSLCLGISNAPFTSSGRRLVHLSGGWILCNEHGKHKFRSPESTRKMPVTPGFGLKLRGAANDHTVSRDSIQVPTDQHERCLGDTVGN